MTSQENVFSYSSSKHLSLEDARRICKRQGLDFEKAKKDILANGSKIIDYNGSKHFSNMKVGTIKSPLLKPTSAPARTFSAVEYESLESQLESLQSTIGEYESSAISNAETLRKRDEELVNIRKEKRKLEEENKKLLKNNSSSHSDDQSELICRLYKLEEENETLSQTNKTLLNNIKALSGENKKKQTELDVLKGQVSDLKIQIAHLSPA